MMESHMIYVPISDFIDGIKAIADLDSVRALIYSDADYCSNGIKAVLGIPIEGEQQ